MNAKHKVSCILIVLGILAPGSLQSQWNWQYPLPQGNLLRALCFPGETTGYAAGHAGTVMKSTDGGQTWLVSGFLGTKNFNCLDFIDDQTGVVAGNAGIVFITTDGGAGWTNISSLSTDDIYSVAMVDASEIYTVAMNTLLRSEDAGQSWEPLQVNPTGKYMNILSLSSSHIIIGGFDGTDKVVLFHSTDGGGSWTSHDPGIGPVGIYNISFSDEMTGYLFGLMDAPLFKTTDGGYSWNQVGTEIRHFDDVYFFDATHGKAIDIGWIKTTSDGGVTWEMDQYPFYNHLWKFAATPSGKLFGAGFAGCIMEYDSGSQDWDVKCGGMNLSFLHVQMNDDATGLILGDEYVLHTNDNGMTWNWQVEPAMYSPIAACFINPDTGWIMDASLNTRLTEDGGYTWSRGSDMLQTKNLFFQDLAFSDFYNGFKVGGAMDEFGDEYPVVHRTTDGENWDVFDIPQASGWLNRIRFLNQQVGFILGTDGQIFKTTDGGNSWNRVHILPDLNLNDICFVEDNIAYACGEIRFSLGIRVLKSFDYGETWNVIYSSEEPEGLNIIEFTNEQKGFVVAGSEILKTTDGGLTWQPEDINNDNGLRDICLVGEDLGFAVGSGNTILKLGSIAAVPRPACGKHFIHAVIYPNPVAGKSVLKYYLHDQGHVEISLYDLQGSKIRDLLCEDQHKGEKSLSVDVSGLQDGVYLIRISSGRNMGCSKLIINN